MILPWVHDWQQGICQSGNRPAELGNDLVQQWNGFIAYSGQCGGSPLARASGIPADDADRQPPLGECLNDTVSGAAAHVHNGEFHD
jgi:hypothetical protein